MLTGIELSDRLRNMNLREARFKANQMSQPRLSLKTKISQSTLSLIENGLKLPNEKEVKLIAKALKTRTIEYKLSA